MPGLFMWVLGIQTWVPMLAQQSLSPQIHLSKSPFLTLTSGSSHPTPVSLFDLNNFLTFSRETI